MDNLTLNELHKMGKFKLGSLLAKSLSEQKTMLNKSRLCLQAGLPRLAKRYLANFHVERNAYKLALHIQNI